MLPRRAWSAWAPTWTKGTAASRQRAVTVAREVDWLGGERRFPGELRLPRRRRHRQSREPKPELKDRCRFDTRYYISSAKTSAEDAAKAVGAIGA